MKTENNDSLETATSHKAPVSEYQTNKALVTWIFRILVGGTFIFSGFVKGVDPWGTFYQVEEYLNVMGLHVWHNLKLTFVFALCATEFMLGVFLVLGCFRRTVAIFTIVFMIVMLLLTLWIAVFNPVADCGCFGEAIKLSNWGTFFKNVILTAGAYWLLINNLKAPNVITPALQWIGFIVTAIFILTVETYGYNVQPLVDFRPYKAGESLADLNEDSEAPEFVFIYEKDGERKEFGESDELPDESDGWLFVERKEMNEAKSSEQIITVNANSFRIWSEDGSEDVTSEVIEENSKLMLVMIPELRYVSPATTWQLNAMHDWCLKNGVGMGALVSGSDAEIAEWKDVAMADYDIYRGDDTQIKEVVRGNPGVVYAEDGIVVWKSTLLAIDADDFQRNIDNGDARCFARDYQSLLRNIVMIYIVIMTMLVAVSLFPAMKKLPTRGDMVRHEG